MPEPHRLLFVCTANICRSPVAEEIARMYGEERGWAVEVRSAGVHALADQPAAPNMIRAARELGGDISRHRSSPLTEEHVRWADRILVMEIRHASAIREKFPGADEKVQLLGTFGGLMEIADPYGSWFYYKYRNCKDELVRCVHAFMDRLPPRPR